MEFESLLDKEELGTSSHKTLIDLVMPKDDPRRRTLIDSLEIYEDETILKRDSDFTTIIDKYIT